MSVPLKHRIVVVDDDESVSEVPKMSRFELLSVVRRRFPLCMFNIHWQQFVRTLFCAGLLIVAARLFAETESLIDASRCFPRLLQDSRVQISSENTKLAILSVWSLQTCTSLKETGKLQTVIEDLPIGASFDVASEAVEKIFRKNQLNFQRESWTGIWETKLDPAAKDIITACIKEIAESRWGLSYEYRISDQSHIKLVLHWN